MKKIIVMAVMTLLMISMNAAPGLAGSRDRNRVRGIVIGAGAVLVATALVNGFHHDDRVNVVIANRRGYRPCNRGARHQRGGRAWTAPRYERRWNPGHDNRRGGWANGRYERGVKNPGRTDRPNRAHR